MRTHALSAPLATLYSALGRAQPPKARPRAGRRLADAGPWPHPRPCRCAGPCAAVPAAVLGHGWRSRSTRTVSNAFCCPAARSVPTAALPRPPAPTFHISQWAAVRVVAMTGEATWRTRSGTTRASTMYSTFPARRNPYALPAGPARRGRATLANCFSPWTPRRTVRTRACTRRSLARTPTQRTRRRSTGPSARLTGTATVRARFAAASPGSSLTRFCFLSPDRPRLSGSGGAAHVYDDARDSRL